MLPEAAVTGERDGNEEDREAWREALSCSSLRRNSREVSRAKHGYTLSCRREHVRPPAPQPVVPASRHQRHANDAIRSGFSNTRANAVMAKNGMNQRHRRSRKEAAREKYACQPLRCLKRIEERWRAACSPV